MDFNAKAGAVVGAATGFSKFLLNIDTEFIKRLIESGFAAMVSGALGALGSFLIMMAIKKIPNGKFKKTDKKSDS